MWWSLLEISWRSFFSFNEENENKFETERCTENFQAKFDEMEMLEQVLTKGAYVAARHRVCCSEAGSNKLLAARLVDIVDMEKKHAVHGIENLHPPLVLNVSTAGLGWKKCYHMLPATFWDVVLERSR